MYTYTYTYDTHTSKVFTNVYGRSSKDSFLRLSVLGVYEYEIIRVLLNIPLVLDIFDTCVFTINK